MPKVKPGIMRVIKNHLLLLVIIGVSFALRIYQVSSMPPALNWDEVSIGYNAYALHTTGADEWGKSLPTLFRAYGDYKLPVYVYLTVPFIAVFGLTEFAVRLPSVLFGTLSVLFTYLLIRQLLRGERKTAIAIMCAALMATEPWSLFTSRVALEANAAVFCVIAGTYFFLKGLRTINYLPFASLFFGLSVWSYNSARVFTPLFLLSLLVIYRKEIIKINRKLSVFCLLLIGVFVVPMFSQLANPAGRARYSEVQIIDAGTLAQIDEARGSGCPRIQCNKVTYTLSRFAKNYISHFGPKFLFTDGGSNYQFSIPGRGLLYLVNLPFFYIGLVIITSWALKLRNGRERRRESLVLLSWLLLAPIASSLTREAPHVLRSIVSLPMPMVLSACGFIWVVDKLKKSLRLVTIMIYIIVVLMLFENYLISYFNDYGVIYSQSWQYGYKEMTDFVKENYAEYDNVVVSKKYGEPHEFLLFYGVNSSAPWPWKARDYQVDPNLNRFYQSNWYWVDQFAKFYFVNDWELTEDRVRENQFALESGGVVDCRDKKCLLVASDQDFSKVWKKLMTVNFLDGKPAFEIYENK